MKEVRLLIFVQQDSPYALHLFSAITSHRGIKVVGIVSCGKQVTVAGRLKIAARMKLQRMMDPTLPDMPLFPRFETPPQIAARHDAHHRNLVDGDLKNPDLLRSIEGFNATHLINLYTLQKFPPTFLGRVEGAINYHNGLLPWYRGLKATHWSLYRREPESGFTWHFMDENFDTGNILLSDTVGIGQSDGVASLEWKKTCLAVEQIPQLMRLLSETAPGSAQPSGGMYFSRADYQEITHIPDTSLFSSDELRWRQRCFTRVLLGHKGLAIPVTRFAKSDNPKAMFRFQCKGGNWLTADRCDFLPPAIFNWRK